MKKWIALIMVLVVCLTMAACGSKGKSLEDIQKAGKLVVATSPDFPPFEYLEGDKVVGIEVDILQMIADELGVQLVIEQMDFDSVLHGVQSGKYDVGMSGITINDKRKKNADFTQPYFLASQAIVVMADSSISGKADLTGKKISVQTGTTADEYCRGEGYDVYAYQANNDACSALTSGKVDAWVVDNEVALDLSAKTNGATKVLNEAMTTEPYGFAFAKGSTTLVAKIDELLDQWLADGTIKAIFDKYEVPFVSPK